jgi:hypothetical protein
MRHRTDLNLETVRLSGFAAFTILLCAAVLSSTTHLPAQKSEVKLEVAGASHSAYVSRPEDVADVIESAAREVSK